MKTKTLLFVLLFLTCIGGFLKAQNLSGKYAVTGYFFHPSTSRFINLTKTITRVSTNTYQVDYTGDLTGWGFQFTVDASNHLTNWVAVGSTYPAPASGFMTADDPGGFFFGGTKPGTDPWVQSTYNNIYDPLTHTFYMHYGYNISAGNQNGYDRQVYEKYVLIPSPKIISVTPLNGTSFTQVIIRGRNFSAVDPTLYAVTFGDAPADSIKVVSATKIMAWVGSGANGNVQVADRYNNKDKFPNFVYTPVPPVTNPQWSYVGKAGFSPNGASNVTAASGTNGVSYVAFVDLPSSKIKVMKYNGTKWVAAGAYVSAGKSLSPRIVLTKKNLPVVAYVDSLNGGNITVKKFGSGLWTTLGSPGFAPAEGSFASRFSMAIDGAGIPYILSIHRDTVPLISVLKWKDGAWANVGHRNFAVSFSGEANLAIDKTTNTPYIIFDDRESHSYGHQATVMKFDGTNWVTIGNPGFTAAKQGIDFPDIQIDGGGNPIASIQDDDGFERQSVYQYKDGVWAFVGSPRFSKGRSSYNSVGIDKKDNLFALFKDGSYNKQGTVMKFSKANSKWDTLGARGFIPCTDFLERGSLIFDMANTPMIAFSDKTHGGKVSVMKFDNSPLAIIDKGENTDNISVKNKTGISIFPNPAHSAIIINFIAGDANTTLQVINAKGQPVIQQRIASFAGKNNNVHLDISTLSAGSYILLLKGKNKTYTGQFIKE